MTDVLFTPLAVGQVELPNRIVFLPHVTFYAERAGDRRAATASTTRSAPAAASG